MTDSRLQQLRLRNWIADAKRRALPIAIWTPPPGMYTAAKPVIERPAIVQSVLRHGIGINGRGRAQKSRIGRVIAQTNTRPRAGMRTTLDVRSRTGDDT